MQLVNLIIQGTPVVNDADTKQAHCDQVNQTGDPFALVKTMNTENTQKSE